MEGENLLSGNFNVNKTLFKNNSINYKIGGSIRKSLLINSPILKISSVIPHQQFNIFPSQVITYCPCATPQNLVLIFGVIQFNISLT